MLYPTQDVVRDVRAQLDNMEDREDPPGVGKLQAVVDGRDLRCDEEGTQPLLGEFARWSRRFDVRGVEVDVRADGKLGSGTVAPIIEFGHLFSGELECCTSLVQGRFHCRGKLLWIG